MDLQTAYIWLDKIKQEKIKDNAHDKEIEAIEVAQKIVREKITGIAEE